MHDERATIGRVLAGDTAAFRVLVEAYQSLVLQFARNMLRTIEDAEDISQEVFVAAFQSLRQFDATRAKFSTWLLTITRNRCLNHLKRPQTILHEETEQADHSSHPPDVAMRNEVFRHLNAALEALPLDLRTAFVLADIQELPYAEIAIIEQIELGTVKSRVSRARERLRQAMGEWQPAGSNRPASRSRDADRQGERHDLG